MMILGALAMLAGAVVMILGKIFFGLVLILAGLGLLCFHNAKMFKGAGIRGEDALFNGFGKGRQQSEATKDKTMPQGYEDRPSNIWDQVEGK